MCVLLLCCNVTARRSAEVIMEIIGNDCKRFDISTLRFFPNTYKSLGCVHYGVQKIAHSLRCVWTYQYTVYIVKSICLHCYTLQVYSSTICLSTANKHNFLEDCTQQVLPFNNKTNTQTILIVVMAIYWLCFKKVMWSCGV